MEMEALDSNSEVLSPHPFRVRHIFFHVVSIKRPEKLPEGGIDLGLSTEIAIGLPSDGKDYNLNLRVRSSDGPEIEIEAIGVFIYLDEGDPDQAQLTKFINEHLLIAMTSRVIQVVANLTNQMGMPPIWLPTPRGFGLEVSTVKQLIETFQEELDL